MLAGSANTAFSVTFIAIRGSRRAIPSVSLVSTEPRVALVSAHRCLRDEGRCRRRMVLRVGIVRVFRRGTEEEPGVPVAVVTYMLVVAASITVATLTAVSGGKALSFDFSHIQVLMVSTPSGSSSIAVHGLSPMTRLTTASASAFQPPSGPEGHHWSAPVRGITITFVTCLLVAPARSVATTSTS